MATLCLGTRRSPLALAQSHMMARQLEQNSPGLKITFREIVTTGDRIQNVSLSRVDGKEFFVKELDEALLAGDVDLTVHSLKDLSLERPPGILSATIPKREDPRDVIIFRSDVMERLRARQILRIGTSAPRRLENIPRFLQAALPRFEDAKAAQFELVEIRGNIDSRLGRLEKTDAQALDGVVLALAGLNRLSSSPAFCPASTKRILEQARFMVLPLRECASAPGQGALMIECRSNDQRTIDYLKSLHCQRTATLVSLERQILQESGGGCHQRFGATAVHHEHLGNLLFKAGVFGDGDHEEDLVWSAPPLPKISAEVWDGGRIDTEATKLASPFPSDQLLKHQAFFVAHHRAVNNLDDLSIKHLNASRVWTSGSRSWFALARRGLWVEGCADGLGFEFLQPTLNAPALGLPDLREWLALTHDNAVAGWSLPEATATYRVAFADYEQLRQAVATANLIYWNSVEQFQQLGAHASAKAMHACGPGKTARHLKQILGAKITVFPSAKEWRKWIANIQQH